MADPLPAIGPVAILTSLLIPRSRAESNVSRSNHRFEIEEVDREALSRYCTMLGFSNDAEVPMTYSYLHAFRAHLAVMLSRQFPFSVAGMLHVENDISCDQIYLPRERGIVDVEISLESPTETGAVFLALDTKISQGHRVVATCRSRYLAKRGARTGPAQRRKSEEMPAPKIEARWDVTRRTAWEYARVSGDYNPIHLWRWVARAAGFPSPIIQGMYTVGRAAAGLQHVVGRPLTRISSRFRRPISIPGAVRMTAAGGKYQVWAGDELAVTGEFSHAAVDEVVVETKRTRVRRFRLGDAAFVHEMLTDPDWLRNIGDRGVRDLPTARAYLQNSILDMYARLGFGMYLVELKETGQWIGTCGFVKRDGLEDVDLGYALLPQFRGQGFARETAGAVLDYARNTLGFERVVAVVAPYNEPSSRICRDLGFNFERRVRLPIHNDELYLFSRQLN